jgi:hypothetical protein
MKKALIYFSTFLAAASFLSSCTEDIDVKLPNSEKKVVIEGNIENGKFPEVIITRNIALFTQNSSVAISDFYVFGAEVYVSDGTITDTCTLTIDSASSLGVIYRGHSIVGVPGGVYYLTVKADGKVFSSVTSIPSPIALDSVWWKPEPNQGDSLGYAWAHITEPAGLGNNYRFLAKRPQDRRYLAPFGATWDDKYVDGKDFEFAYSRGYDPTDGTNTFDNESEVTRGFYFNHDTIYIKFTSIDKASKEFYTTFENALSNNGNPFASPVTILTNINGGALGVWCGQSATYDTIMPTP